MEVKKLFFIEGRTRKIHCPVISLVLSILCSGPSELLDYNLFPPSPPPPFMDDPVERLKFHRNDKDRFYKSKDLLRNHC